MSKNTIKIKKYSDVIEEHKASGAITPGMLVIMHSATEVKAHNVSAGNAIPMFALEDELQGNGIDTDYANGAPVQVWIPYRGDIVNGILASGQNVTAGTLLTSDGAGRLKAYAGATSAADALPLEIVGQAIEAVNASSAVKRIQVRIV